MLRPVIQKSKIIRPVQLMFLTCILMACSSSPPENLASPVAAIHAQPETPAGAVSDLISLEIKNVTFNLFDDKNAASIALGATYPGSDAGTPPTGIDYRIVFYDEKAITVLETTGRIGKDTLLHPAKLSGLGCGLRYRLQVYAGTESNAIAAETSIQIPDTFKVINDPANSILADSIPKLFVGKELSGEFSVPLGAKDFNIEFRDKSDAVISFKLIKPFSMSNKPISAANNLSVVNFRTALSETNKDSYFQSRYRFAFPSGVLSGWHLGPIFQTASTETWKSLIPGTGQLCLSDKTQFAWQEFTDYPDYQLEFSLQDPQSPGFSDKNCVFAEARTNHLLISLQKDLPNASEGKTIFWRVRHKKSGIESPWQKCSVQKLLDDLITVIQPGQERTFSMGNDRGPDDSTPAHPVSLSRAFSMAPTAMTNKLCAQLGNQLIIRGFATVSNFQLVSAGDGSVWMGLANLDYGQQFGLVVEQGILQSAKNRDNHPAVGMTWYGANALSQQADFIQGIATGSWRLPSEAEWEYVATCGGQAESPWAAAIQAATCNFLRSRSMYEDLVPPYTRKGGPTVPTRFYEKNRLAAFKAQVQKQPLNPDSALFSQFDMLGNVWEWCGDWYDINYYQASKLSVNNPQGPSHVSTETIKYLEELGQLPSKIVRGGAWNSQKEDIGPRFRGKFPPGQASFSIGMRLVKSLSQ